MGFCGVSISCREAANRVLPRKRPQAGEDQGPTGLPSLRAVSTIQTR